MLWVSKREQYNRTNCFTNDKQISHAFVEHSTLDHKGTAPVQCATYGRTVATSREALLQPPAPLTLVATPT